MSRTATSRIQAVLRYSWQRYPPLFYLVVVTLWSLSLDGMLRTLGGGQGLALSWDLLHVALSVFGVGYFMRIVDELRDYEYDRVHNPERGLAKGDVSFQDLYVALAVCAAILLGSNLAVSWMRALILLGIMVYSLFLWWLELNSTTYQGSMFLTIAVAIQLHVGQGAYVWLAQAERAGRAPEAQGLLVVLGLVFIYLHWEVMRKTAWPGSTKPGEKLYSDEVGSVASSLLAFALVVGASGLMFHLSHGAAWLFLAPVAVGVLNVALFFKTRSPRGRSGRLAGISYFAFLFAMLVHAFAGRYS
ncbi:MULTISPECIES: hypothetical protein [Corallococcus]|nr:MULTISPECIES: hypothetical protein [Corallococcus]